MAHTLFIKCIQLATLGYVKSTVRDEYAYLYLHLYFHIQSLMYLYL